MFLCYHFKLLYIEKKLEYKYKIINNKSTYMFVKPKNNSSLLALITPFLPTTIALLFDLSSLISTYKMLHK
jgi:hypothetical protein